MLDQSHQLPRLAPPLELRLAVNLPVETWCDLVENLFDYLEDDERPLRITPDSIGWDLYRIMGGIEWGFDLFRRLYWIQAKRQADAYEWLTGIFKPVEVPSDEEIEAQFATFNRERQPGDMLIIDEMDEAQAYGWEAPPDIAYHLETLCCVADMHTAVRDMEEAEFLESEIVWERIYSALSDALGVPLMELCISQALKDLPAPKKPDDYPRIPEQAEHPMAKQMPAVIDKVIDYAKVCSPEAFVERVTQVVASLKIVHHQTSESLFRYLFKMKPEPEWQSALTTLDADSEILAMAMREDAERKLRPIKNFEVDAKGRIKNDVSCNVTVYLKLIGAKVRWNNWVERIEIQGFPNRDSQWRTVDDTIIAQLLSRAADRFTGYNPNVNFFLSSLLSLARENTIDPVIDELVRMEAAWDGKPRLATWLHHVCGVPDDPYHSAVGRLIIMGIVYRARRPGIKFDFLPLFIGPQGYNKSLLAERLAIRKDWFSDTIKLADESKELVLSLAGILVAEIAELGGSKRDRNEIKAMLSRQRDRGRTAYARCISDRPRRNIFIGTGNDDKPLSDDTGNRRYLPIRVEREIDLAWLDSNLAQLIGEACALESGGAALGLPREVWALAGNHQEAARGEHKWEILLEAAFGTEGDAEITPADLLNYIERVMRHPPSVQQYSVCMGKLGFKSVSIRPPGKKETVRVWRRGKGTYRYILATNNGGSPMLMKILDQSEEKPSTPALPRR